jgi:uracil-DNA glycosylase family 4
MSFQDVLNFESGKTVATPVKRADGVKAKSSDKKRGCEFCPLNETEGIHKVKNLQNVKGRRIMVWAQNPGQIENRERKNLIGPAGKFLWDHGKAVGLHREDCDLQNVVRCWTVEKNELDQFEPREPSKEEIRCCSLYTEEALVLNQGKARIHLVLGAVAAKALLKGEYRKDQKTFFSKKLNTWVICTYHPSYFLRGAPRSKLKEFKEALAAVVAKSEQSAGQFAYLNKMDYKSVPAGNMEEEIGKPIRAANTRVVVDIEDDEDPDTKKRVIVYIGFSWGKGKSRGLFLQHPQVKQSEDAVAEKIKFIKEILEDGTIRKAMQHGSHDVWLLFKTLGIKVRGYDHDTEYSEYLRFSGRRAFGLGATADIRFRDFAGYKSILDPYRDPITEQAPFLKVPPPIIVKYNGADCDLTKRIEKSNDGKVNQALLQVYIRVGGVLARMEERGPLFDNEYDEQKLQKWIPVQLKKLLKKIRAIAKDENFNPNAPQQVATILYDKLKLQKHLDDSWWEENKRSTGAETLQMLDSYHEFPGLMMEFRKLHKIESTYMKAFRNSAAMHGGRLRTKWWLTGAITGRLRSGGEKNEKNKKKKGIVNFQNIHGDPAVECMLVSDLAWRNVYKDWLRMQNNAQSATAGA